MIVCIFELRTLVRDAGIKDEWNVMLQEPFYMAVSKFCRIAFGFTGNGFDSLLVELMGGLR